MFCPSRESFAAWAVITSGYWISACGLLFQYLSLFFWAQNIYLESVVLGECHNLHDFPDSGKDLEDDVKCDRVHHVLHDHPESE